MSEPLEKTFAEFFAGIGLMRIGLERAGWSIAFANDIDEDKWQMYKDHFGDTGEFIVQDIHNLKPSQVPSVSLATASFPCNDLSLAGARHGLAGAQSSAFWGFIDILKGMKRERRLPPLVLLENVPGFLSSNDGRDFEDALQHLVGAKLDVVLGQGKIHHHGFSVADHSTDRKADYQVEAVAIHVTTHPTEALVRKCGTNIKAGLKPLIITLGEAVRPAEFILATFELKDRVDVLDAAQFLTANVYERSLFKAAECKVTLAALLARYNAIVDECETDPSLRIKLTG